MSNSRIEEVDDDDDDDVVDDPGEMDLDAFDFSRPQQGVLGGSTDATDSQMSAEDVQAMLQPRNQPSGSGRPQMPELSEKDKETMYRQQKEQSKDYQSIYPVYFDATRSRDQGRRVSKEDAIENPLAREIVDAVQNISQTLGVKLPIYFEPDKCHPKDWANPGRVKVQVKKDGKPVSAKVQNKHHLYKLIADYLQQHPATNDTPMRFKPQGLPMKEDNYEPPAVPRGFKMGTILPLHSPALSGGGVSDNFLKDMMAEMGGQLPEGMEGMAKMAGMGGGGGGAPKKIKVGKKR